MHEEAKHFMLWVKYILGDYFINKRVLDVGSGDINGNNRFLFENCIYDGNDVIAANNVTIVSKTKDLQIDDETLDTIVSTECFEHDPEYQESLKKIYKMLKPGGLFCFTCASTNRPEHGTARTNPKASLGTIGELDDMVNYYKNLTEKDLHKALNLPESFSAWNTYYNAISRDLYFVGIKKTIEEETRPQSLQEYRAPGVANTTSYIEKEYKILDLYPHINVNDWIFHPGCDSGNNDIKRIGRMPYENQLITADATAKCVAFNTLGFLKSHITLPFITNKWMAAPHGLYVKKSIYSNV